MAKLSEADKKEIIIEYTAGATITEIAQKFQVSHTSISKILKQEKSCKKLQNAEKVSKEISNREIAQKIKNNIMPQINEKVKSGKLDIRNLLLVLEKMTLLFNLTEDGEITEQEKNGVEFVFKDMSMGAEDENNPDT